MIIQNLTYLLNTYKRKAVKVISQPFFPNIKKIPVSKYTLCIKTIMSLKSETWGD